MENRLESLIKAGKVKAMDEDEAEDDDEVEEHDQVQLDVTQRDINITQTQACALSNLNLPNIPITYSIAKTPLHKNLTVEKLMEKFSTSNFLPALLSFLCHIFLGPTITPSHHDRFDTYKQLVIPMK